MELDWHRASRRIRENEDVLGFAVLEQTADALVPVYGTRPDWVSMTWPLVPSLLRTTPEPIALEVTDAWPAPLRALGTSLVAQRALVNGGAGVLVAATRGPVPAESFLCRALAELRDVAGSVPAAATQPGVMLRPAPPASDQSEDADATALRRVLGIGTARWSAETLHGWSPEYVRLAEPWGGPISFWNAIEGAVSGLRKGLARAADTDVTLTVALVDAWARRKWFRVHLTHPEGVADVLVYVQDVSEGMRRAENLEAHRERYATLFKDSHDPVIVHDLMGRIVDANRAAESAFGIPNLVGGHVGDLHPDGGFGGPGLELVHAAGRSTFRTQFVAADARLFDAEVSASLVRVDDATYVQAIIRDVTERERAHRELVAAKEAAESASRARADFLATMSHEIRTPLNAILGATELAMREAPNEAFVSYLERVERNASTLARMVTDVLDSSKLEAGQLAIEHEAFSPEESLRAVVDDLAQLAAPGVAVRCVCRALPQRCAADAHRIQQIVRNLLHNAAKYTEVGEIVIRAHSTIIDEGAAWLQVEVDDTGVGIPAEDVEAVFERFRQGARPRGGAGLGLAISRSLAELLGGTLELESVEGEGTCARLRVPVERLAVLPTPPPLEASGTRPAPPLALRVLVAEDCDDSRDWLAKAIAATGHEVYAVADGEPALEALREREFDIALVDLQMPRLGGLALARAWRALESGSERLRMVAVSAHTLASHRHDALSAGFDRFVTKPLRLAALEGLLEEVLHPARLTPMHGVQRVTDADPEMSALRERYVSRRTLELDALADAIQAGDHESVREGAHRVKGSGGLHGFHRLSEAAGVLEDAARRDDDDGILAAWRVYRDAVTALRGEPER